MDGEWVGVGKGVRITAPPPDPPLPARASPAWSPARLHERGGQGRRRTGGGGAGLPRAAPPFPRSRSRLRESATRGEGGATPPPPLPSLPPGKGGRDRRRGGRGWGGAGRFRSRVLPPHEPSGIWHRVGGRRRGRLRPPSSLRDPRGASLRVNFHRVSARRRCRLGDAPRYPLHLCLPGGFHLHSVMLQADHPDIVLPAP